MKIMQFENKVRFRSGQPKDWGNQDIAEFYRVSDILEKAGLKTEVESGLSDEGDPWFVFVRPENGDVVAHFARIDGEFIAVSALNHEIYRGRDIREIVNRMLLRHPMLLPRTEDGGTIYLHPMAALTAFVAAAFILSLDGVRARDLTEIIVAASDSSNPSSIIVPDEDGIEQEHFRNITIETNPQNYNVALLGAALIVHALPTVEENWTKNSDAQEQFLSRVFLSQSQEINFSEDFVFVNQKPLNAFDDNRANIFQESDLDAPQEVSVKQGSSETDLSVNSVQAIFQHTHKNELIDYSFANIGMDYVAALTHGGNNLNDGLDARPILNEFGIKSEQKSLFNLGVIQNEQLSDEYLSELAGNIYQAVDTFSFYDTKNSSPQATSSGSEGLAVVLGDKGNLLLFSLNTLVSSGGFSTIDESIGLETGLFPYGETSIVGLDKQNDVVVAHPGIVDPAPKQELNPFQHLPIKGHALDLYHGRTLGLSNAVDVVFYNGGISEVANFELGKDLLWFFLSPDELGSSESRVNEAGDLILDFGETGTLTFYDVVNDSSVSSFV